MTGESPRLARLRDLFARIDELAAEQLAERPTLELDLGDPKLRSSRPRPHPAAGRPPRRLVGTKPARTFRGGETGWLAVLRRLVTPAHRWR